MAYYTAGIIGPYIRDAVVPNLFDISGGNIRTTGALSVGTFASSNLIAPGYIRNDLAGSVLDISEGNITVTGTTSSANVLASGYLRNNLTATEFDISGGNISNSATTRSSNFIGTATTSNQIGGVTLSSSDISMSATGRIFASIIRNALTPSLFDISGGNINITGTITAGSISAPSTTNSNLVVTGYLRNSLTPSQFDISGGNISNSATHISSNFIGTSTASNQIGGVTLSSSDISMSATGRVLAPILRNALTPSTYDISGGNISNSATTRSSNFIGTATTSNQIGGVTLSSSDISMSATGRVLAPILRNALIPTQFDISGGNISNSATHISSNFISTATASNQIGGVTLSSSDISMSATGRILAPILRNALIPTEFDISEGNISNAGTSTTTNSLVSGYLRNDLTATQFDISGGNISNSGVTTSSNIRVGASTLSRSTALIDAGRGADNIGGDGTPLLAMQYAGGGYRHFVRGRHNVGSNNGNAIDFFINASTELEGSLAPGNGNRLAVSMTPAGVGIGMSNPVYALDVSGTTETDNALVPGYLRNNLTATQFDISGGNIRNTGTTSSANVLVSGYLRNALTATEFDISGGNISNSATTRSSNFIGTTASASNQIGGVTFSNSDISMSATGRILAPILRNALIPTEFDISGGNISNSSRILTGPGSAAAPAYSFGADRAMGLYDAGANVLGVATAGTQRLTIDQSGNMNNNNLFYFWSNVNLPGSAAQALHFAGTSGSPVSGRILFGDGTGWQMRFAQRNTTTTDLVTIDDRARLGIGVQSPAFALDISGLLSSDGVRIVAANPTIDMYVRGTETGVSVMRMFANATTGGLAQFDSGRSLSLIHGINSTQRLTITPAGNIGIGANYTAPQFALDVCSSSTAATAVFRNSSAQQAAIWLVSGAGAAYTTGLEMYHDPTTQGLYSTNALPFTIWTGGVRRMTILNTGEVGIGTTAPGTNYGLDVATGVASSASINMSTWPRVPVGNTYVAKGVAAYSAISPSNAVRFNAALQNINAELATVTNDVSYGTYFVIRKSGIWSIQAGPFNHLGGGGGTSGLDVCNGFTGVTLPAFGPTALDQVQTASGLTKALTYTGFLPANTGLYYKVYQNNPTLTTNSNTARFVLSFIAETSAGPANYPV